MELINAPNYDYLSPEKRSLFLAGGISNCQDWQKEVIEKLSNQNITIVNPRRPGILDIKDNKMAREQITWEHFYLNKTKEVLFWFPHNTLCPITLFELGARLQKRSSSPSPQTIYIGCDPNYQRLLDVEIQTKILFPTFKIVNTIDDLVAQIINV